MAITNNLKISRTGVYLLSLLALTIVIVPLAAAALTLTADKEEYVPGDTLVVNGTATPDSAVAIQVYNPAGGRVAFGQGSTDGVGAFSVNVLVWPAAATASMPFGTYRISASDAGNGDIAEITVDFIASVTTTTTATTSVSTTTVTTTVTITSRTTSTTTSTTTATTTLTTTSTSRITSRITQTTTNTVTTTLPQVTTTTTAVTTTTATSSVTNTVTAQAVTQTSTSTVTTQVTSTEEVGFSSTVTYAAVAVAVIAIIGAAVLTMKQRGML